MQIHSSLQVQEKDQKQRLIALLISLSFFIASCFFACLFAGGTHWGFELLLRGFAALPFRNFAWLANLVYLYAIVTFLKARYQNTIFWCIVAMLLSLDTFLFFWTGFPDWGNLRIPFLGIGIGFYLWLSSMGILAFESVLLSLRIQVKWFAIVALLFLFITSIIYQHQFYH